MKTQYTFLLSITLILSFTLISCKEEEPEDTSFTFESVSGFVISEQGEKLLATNMGLCSLDVSTGTYVAVENELGETALNEMGETALNEMGETSLNDLVFDGFAQQGDLWLASDRGAYNYSSDYLLNTENSGLQNNQVNQIGFNTENIAFYATPDGISISDGTSDSDGTSNHENSTWTHYTGLFDFYLSHEISDIGSASNGYTYVSTYGGGIERFKAGVDGISSATIMDSDWTALRSNYINSVFIDDTTQVYATDEGVAFHFSEYTKWDWELYTTENSELINDTVLSVNRDPSGLWWIGTANGICMFDESNWTSFTTEEHDLASNQIQYLAIDTDGTVWAASDLGLSHYSNGLWISYPQ